MVYGSLVPLQFAYRPLADAWYAFAHIPYLELGVASRADWVANILLYIPLAFFALGSLARRLGAGPANLLVFACCVVVAVVIEFTQLFFPPRTVSLNDLIAETIGTTLGIALWRMAGAQLSELWREVQHGGLQGARALIALYTAAYLTYSLFPFDFLVTGRELADKLAVPGAALVFSASCGHAFNCAALLVSEVVIAMPLGALLAMLHPGLRPSAARAFAWGLLLGLVIELLQIFLASGVSQGLSILTRGIGMALGLALYRSFRREWLIEYRAQLKVIALTVLPLYGVLLLAMIGFFTSSFVSGSVALTKLRAMHFIPFYYHYFTTETQAMHSLLFYAGAYAPLGAIVWIFREGRSGPWLSSFFAFAVAAAMETLKLFFEGGRSDPTDALIAAAAAALACFAARRLAHRAPSASSGRALMRAHGAGSPNGLSKKSMAPGSKISAPTP